MIPSCFKTRFCFLVIRLFWAGILLSPYLVSMLDPL
jgi:hypothetical protein